MLRWLCSLLCLGLPAAAQVSVQALLDEAVANRATRLELPRGIVPVTGRLLLNGAENLEIDGTGTTLLFNEWRGTGWTVNNCRGLTLRGLTVDYDPVPFIQARLTAVADDGKWVDFEVAAGYPTLQPEQLDHYRQAYLFEPGQERWKRWVPDLYGKVEILSPSRGRFTFWRPPDLYQLIAVGDRIVFTVRAGGAMRFNNCEDITVDKLTFLAAPGAALLGRYLRGDNTFSYDIKPGPPPAGATEPRLLSTCADGFNIAFATKGPTLTGCNFSFMGDDSVNLHGATLAVLRVESPTAVIVGWPYSPEYLATVVPVGAVARRLAPDNWAVLSSATVTGFEPLRDKTEADQATIARVWPRNDPQRGTAFRLSLAEPLAAEPGEFIDIPASNSPGFVIRDNVFSDHRARGCRIMASDGVIERNTFRRLKMTAVSLGNEYGFWREAGWVTDVIVRDNIIEEVGHDPGAFSPSTSVLGAISLFSHHDRGVTAEYWPGNQNIRIENNLFRGCAVAAVYARAARGLVVRGNQIDHVLYHAPPTAGSSAGLSVTAPIDVAGVLEATVTDNTITNVSVPPDAIPLPPRP